MLCFIQLVYEHSWSSLLWQKLCYQGELSPWSTYELKYSVGVNACFSFFSWTLCWMLLYVWCYTPFPNPVLHLDSWTDALSSLIEGNEKENNCKSMAKSLLKMLLFAHWKLPWPMHYFLAALGSRMQLLPAFISMEFAWTFLYAQLRHSLIFTGQLFTVKMFLHIC